jgi:hypothetical protein
MKEQKSNLKTSTKFKTIHAIVNDDKISPIIDELEVPAIIDFHDFVWDLAVEFGIKVRGKKFSRKEITRHMSTTSAYQKRMGCPEKVYYCKGTHCIHTHPDCAKNKIKDHVDIMAQVIRGFIQSEKQKEITL